MMRFVLVFLLFAAPVHACLWGYRTTLDGKRTPSGSFIIIPDGPAAMRAHWEDEQKKLERKTDFESRNDYAVAILHLGKTAEAIAIFEALERERAGLYQTAANLGTAYELAGRNEDALHWIREGIRRNPQSHWGTEWVHVAILEAKLKQARDPKWLATRSVLGLDFGSGVRPSMPKRLPDGNDGKPVTAQALKDALSFQLGERTQFVEPPDAIVADLYFAWGNIEALTASLEKAVVFYDEALRFGVPREALAKKRLAHMETVIREAASRAGDEPRR